MDNQQTPFNIDPYGVTQPSTNATIPASTEFDSFFPGQVLPGEVVPMPYGGFTDPVAALPQPGFNYDQMADLPTTPSGSTAGPSHMGGGEQGGPTGSIAPEGVRGVSEEMRERRRRKNRASQAAFRERRKQQIKLLEEQLAALQKTCESLDARNTELSAQRGEMQAEIERLQAENQRLRTSLEASPVSDTSANAYEAHLPKPVEPPFNPQQQRR